MFMLRSDVWAETGVEPDGGMLCVGCVEKRLGATLGTDDFSEAPLKGPPWSERLFVPGSGLVEEATA